ncbi:hypothetical protein GALMADRAFT_1350210 [Galerina marginata CBS 339.88]|uniref:Uncharacterized protein n=1 Tax=Galerina marginata (strain CBS 339.88) TaxID=685588 RepID=A0A067SHD3_GALM3|nr:hypothetical protein GALMADRAFT_1350210 [Galerina marginata CBS 339.88]
MLFIVIILYLFQGFFNADAARLSTIFPRQTSTDLGAPQECICPNTRSNWDIVWSCLATIFVCTWVSVHPNIPALGEPWWRKSFRRMGLMFWSIIAPELILYWAAKQWAAAQKLATKYKEHRWTMSHGYFIQMGGFMLYDNNKAIGVLDPDKLDRLIEDGKIVMPQTTEQEIQDRSKSDGLSKALVVIQTTWFIGQCIARKAQSLIITELELATLAFAAVNGVMYMFWWFKPLDVQTTVRVDLLLPNSQKPDVQVEPEVVQGDDISPIPREFRSGDLELILTPGRISEIGRDDVPAGPTEIKNEHENLVPSLDVSSRPNQSIKNSKFQGLCPSVWWLVSGILFRWPATGVDAVINSDRIDKGAMGVPMFYTSYTDSLPTDKQYEETYAGFIVFYSLPFVGILFGAIHCAGWGFSFPSLIEANTWQTSSAIITSVPAKFGDYFFVPKSLENNILVQKIPGLLISLFFYVIGGALPFYILARLALLVVALTTLRDLPPEALETVKWTLFLPHI